MQRRRLTLTLFVALAAGCESQPDIRIAEALPSERIAIPAEAIVAVFELPPDFYAGVAVEPDTGRRLTISRNGQVREIGATEMLWAAPDATDTTWGYTDLAGLGDGRVALTAMSDGYVAQLPDGALVPHFCYEPGWMPQDQPVNLVQLSKAVALDPVTDRLYAQPNSIEWDGTGAITERFVAAYDAETGAELTWWRVPDDLLFAGGMAVLEGGEDPVLLVGNTTRLYTFHTVDGTWGVVGELFTDRHIEGLAIDRVNHTLLVLAAHQVVEVDLGALAL